MGAGYVPLEVRYTWQADRRASDVVTEMLEFEWKRLVRLCVIMQFMCTLAEHCRVALRAGRTVPSLPARIKLVRIVAGGKCA